MVFFHVSEGYSLEINNFTVTNCNHSCGGAIYNYRGNVKYINSKITGNIAKYGKNIHNYYGNDSLIEIDSIGIHIWLNGKYRWVDGVYPNETAIRGYLMRRVV